MSAPDEWMTIAEVAQRIGVSERSIRRMITRQEYTAHTRQDTRQTKTGTRQTTLIAAAFLPVLAQHFEKVENTAQDGAGKSAGSRQNTAPAALNTALTAALERVISEKDERIADLQRELDKAHNREGELLAALHREQTLRALLPAPAETTPERTGSPETAETAEPDNQDTRRAWWQIWKRG